MIKEEATTRLHGAIAETVGNLVLHTVDKLITTAEQQDLFENQYLRFVFNLIEKSNNKVAQSCAISCLSKVVACCPDAILVGSLDEITDKIVSLLKMRTFQNKQQLLECLISIVFHLREEFASYYHKFIHYLIDTIKTTDPKAHAYKRVAIDAIYSLAVHCQAEIAPLAEELLGILDGLRSDKHQPVRAAAQETIKVLKEVREANQFNPNAKRDLFHLELPVVDNQNDGLAQSAGSSDCGMLFGDLS